MEMRGKVRNGVYLVIDPSMNEVELLEKLREVLHEEITALQVWDNFYKGQNVEALINKICNICQERSVPVFINNQWELLQTLPLDGIHFDEIPEDFNKIKNNLERSVLYGLTCNNNLEEVKWAKENHLDYISFCSVFPSSTSNSCDLVSFDTIKKAALMTDFPIFLAGGIKPDNMEKLKELNYSGVAVVSGIMSAEEPRKAIRNYLNELKNRENES